VGAGCCCCATAFGGQFGQLLATLARPSGLCVMDVQPPKLASSNTVPAMRLISSSSGSRRPCLLGLRAESPVGRHPEHLPGLAGELSPQGLRPRVPLSEWIIRGGLYLAPSAASSPSCGGAAAPPGWTRWTT